MAADQQLQPIFDAWDGLQKRREHLALNAELGLAVGPEQDFDTAHDVLDKGEAVLARAILAAEAVLSRTVGGREALAIANDMTTPDTFLMNLPVALDRLGPLIAQLRGTTREPRDATPLPPIPEEVRALLMQHYAMGYDASLPGAPGQPARRWLETHSDGTRPDQWRLARSVNRRARKASVARLLGCDKSAFSRGRNGSATG